MCTLAHVLESEGIATVALAANRDVATAMHPPRALYCDFPHGRPLGHPRDPASQQRVLDAAFELLTRPGPCVFEEFPEAIHDVSEAAACPIPPRFDPSLPAAVDEAQALRPAWQRAYKQSGHTQVGGRTVSPDEIIDAVRKFVAIADGEPWPQAGFADENDLVGAGLDIRAYAEELALALSDHVPAARSAEAWLFQQTETGKLLKAAVERLRHADPPLPTLGLIIPRYLDTTKAPA